MNITVRNFSSFAKAFTVFDAVAGLTVLTNTQFQPSGQAALTILANGAGYGIIKYLDHASNVWSEVGFIHDNDLIDLG